MDKTTNLNLDLLKKHYEKYGNVWYSFGWFVEEMKKIRTAILNKKLVIVHKWWNKYDVYYIHKCKPIRLSYLAKRLIWYRYNTSDGTISITAIWTSHTLEITLKLWYSVGLDYDYIPQNQIIL